MPTEKRAEKAGAEKKNDKRTCYVIMPFSQTKNHTEEHWTKHFDYLKNIIDKSGTYIAEKSTRKSENMQSKIFKKLTESDAIIADITDNNFNVVLELGVRFSFKHHTIVIADNSVDHTIPFHLKHYGVIPYCSKNYINHDFEKSILTHLDSYINDEDEFDSPVLEYMKNYEIDHEIAYKKQKKLMIESLFHEIDYNIKMLRRIKLFLEADNFDVYTYFSYLYGLRFICMEYLITTSYIRSIDVIENARRCNDVMRMLVTTKYDTLDKDSKLDAPDYVAWIKRALEEIKSFNSCLILYWKKQNIR